MLEKLDQLVNAVLEWWKEHQYDTKDCGDIDYYIEEPKLVTIAKEIKKELDLWFGIGRK